MPAFTQHEPPPLGGFLITVGAAFGYAAGWNPYASDYTRYLPPETPRGPVALFAGLGVLPVVLPARDRRRGRGHRRADGRRPELVHRPAARRHRQARPCWRSASAPSRRTCSTSTRARCRSWRSASSSRCAGPRHRRRGVRAHRPGARLVRPARTPARTTRTSCSSSPTGSRPWLGRGLRRPAPAPRSGLRAPSPRTVAHATGPGRSPWRSAWSCRSGCSPTRPSTSASSPSAVPERRRPHPRGRVRHRRCPLRRAVQAAEPRRSASGHDRRADAR